MTLFPSGPPPARRLSLVRLCADIARSVGSLGRVAVEGEVHRPTRRPGGRVFFTLRDRVAQITVTCPAARVRRCRTVSGERVLVTGSLEWVSSWGSLQLVAEEVIPVGEGAVAAAIAEARARLAADGLLRRPRRPIPRLPSAIGVVCGSEAAVRADIESVVAARFPGYPVVFHEVPVSGPGAAETIGAALRDLDARPEVEVVVLARGGGDAPQLLPFSDEDLCRAICATRVPVVSAIGHEGDRPLCDEVADLRCGTPSLAAAAVVPDRAALHAELAALLARADGVIERRLAEAARRLAAVDRARAVTAGLARAAERLARSAGRLELLHPRTRWATATAALDSRRRQLDGLDPARVLRRGYAVVRTADGTVVRSASQVAVGEPVRVELAAGRLDARVEAAGAGA
jgi:exodeoxyribonuclease VII large subunit